METFAVVVFPVAKPDEWRAWADSIARGDRADAHRQMMRRLGIKREHIRYQASPAGDVKKRGWKPTWEPSARTTSGARRRRPR
jgi:hypothetical protein